MSKSERDKLIDRLESSLIADDRDICGIGPFSTGQDDPFIRMCELHDKSFVLKENGEETLSRYEVDRRFLNAMLIRAGDSLKLRARAYLYYGFARAFGAPFWKW